MTRPRLLSIAPVVLGLSGLGVVAQAFWTAPGVGNASAGAGSLTEATIGAPASAINAVLVSWSAQASLSPGDPANSAITYAVERRLGSGAFAAVTTGTCAGAKPHGTTSCTDAPAAGGSYTYRVVATYHSWTATSSEAGPVAFTLDTTPPVVQSLNRVDATPTSAGTLHWTVTFSEAVTGVDAGDFALARGGSVSGGSVTSVTGSGASYAVTASTGTGSGTLGLDLTDDDSIVDLGSNPLAGSGTGNGNFVGQTYTIDRTAPSVQSIARADADPTNAATVHWTVTFSEAVTGVDAADFALARGGSLTGGSITSVTGSGTTFTVTATSGTGSGTLGLNLVDDDSIVDGVANPLGGTGAGNGSFTGQAYSLDRTAPTAQSIARADGDPTNATTVHWTVTFSESVTGVGASDFQLARTGTVSGESVTSVTGSGTTYTVTASLSATGDGTLGLNLVDDDSIVDVVGNPLGGAGTTNGSLTGQVYTIDRTAPSLSTLQMFDTNANGKVDQVKATFNETLASSTATAPWTLTNVPSGGTLSSVTTSGAVATLTLSEGAGAADTTVGTFKVALATSASGIRDPAGNQASFAATAPADLAAPGLTALQMFDNNADGKIDRLTATFSETLVSSTATAPWTLTNVPSGGTLTSVSTSGTGATLTLSAGAGAADTAVGAFTVALATSASGIRDAAGNQSSFAATAPADRAGPVPATVSDTDGSTNGKLETGDTFVVTFSEAIAGGLPSSTPITESQAVLANSFLTVTGFTSGALDMTSSYLLLTGTVAFAGTSALSNANKTVTITAGACTSGCLNLATGTGTGMVYAPASGLLDAAGNAATGSHSTGFRIF